jgi:hypothetical protein
MSKLQELGTLVFDAPQEICGSYAEKAAIVSDGNEISFAQLKQTKSSVAWKTTIPSEWRGYAPF